jgi:hypothetical protein
MISIIVFAFMKAYINRQFLIRAAKTNLTFQSTPFSTIVK